MDPASVIGLVAAAAQLVGQGLSVFKHLSGLYKSVKDAPTQAKKLCDEMTTMIDVVNSLKLWLDSFPERIPKSQQTPIANSFDTLNDLLHEMEKRCDPKQMTGFVGRMKWPFQTEETDEYIEKIRRYRGILSLALQTEQMYNLGRFLTNSTLQVSTPAD